MGALWLVVALYIGQAFSNPLQRINGLVPSQECVVAGEGGTAVLAPCAFTSVKLDGYTIISDSNGAITLPTGVTTPVTTTIANEATTIIDPTTLIIQATNSDGQTVISGATEAITLPQSISTTLVMLLPNGETTTVAPDSSQAESNVLSTTIIDGQTVVSGSSGAWTLPTGVGTPTTTTLDSGALITFIPPTVSPDSSSSSSSDIAGAMIIPVTTPISKPEPTPGAAVVPCNFLWFFDLCLNWDDVSITGWSIPLPLGDVPPGPPPGIKPPPGVSISISLPLPEWPHITVPPNGIPTPDPKPDECVTEKGEACFFKTDIRTITTKEATTTTSEVHSTCATVIGCKSSEVSSSTTATESATARAITYAIYPSNGVDSDQVQTLSSQLKGIVADPDSVEEFRATYNGLLYWLLPLNETAAKKAEALPDIATMRLSCGNTCPEDDPCFNPCYDPTTALVFDDLSWANAENLDYLPNEGSEPADRVISQMTYLSQSPPLEGQSVGPRTKEFIFDDIAGGGVDVYILDTGANLGKAEFDDIRDRVTWLPASLDDGDKNDFKSSRGAYHGTAMLSLVAGRTLGIAKRVNPVIVRLPAPFDTGRRVDGIPVFHHFSPEDWLYYLGMIDTALGPDPAEPQPAHAVVLLADFYPRSVLSSVVGGTQGFETDLEPLLKSIIKKGAVVVTGSGSTLAGPANTGIDGFPANFGKLGQNAPTIPELIVAGAISGDGRNIWFESDPANGLPHVYAPGVQILVAQGDPSIDFEYTSSQGTSDAAAYVAGLAAYYIRLAQTGPLRYRNGDEVANTPQGIKDFIVNPAARSPAGTAWSRQRVENEERPGIFNNVDSNAGRCPYDPNRNRIPLAGRFRRAATAACISGTASAPTTTIATTSASDPEATPSSSPEPAEPDECPIFCEGCRFALCASCGAEDEQCRLDVYGSNNACTSCEADCSADSPLDKGCTGTTRV